MYTNIIRYNNTVILTVDGTFQDMIDRMEKYFGKCRGWNIASGHGELWFGKRTFIWDSIEKDILLWDTLTWGCI